MALCDLGLAHTAAVSNCVIRRRPLELHFVEKHNTTCEGVLILDADVLVHVGVALDGGAAPRPGTVGSLSGPQGHLPRHAARCLARRALCSEHSPGQHDGHSPGAYL